MVQSPFNRNQHDHYFLKQHIRRMPIADLHKKKLYPLARDVYDLIKGRTSAGANVSRFTRETAIDSHRTDIDMRREIRAYIDKNDEPPVLTHVYRRCLIMLNLRCREFGYGGSDLESRLKDALKEADAAMSLLEDNEQHEVRGVDMAATTAPPNTGTWKP